jgi:hypothetical protein
MQDRANCNTITADIRVLGMMRRTLQRQVRYTSPNSLDINHDGKGIQPIEHPIQYLHHG